MDAFDESSIIVSAMSSLDASFTANPDANNEYVELEWDANAFDGSSYQAVRIERNGEALEQVNLSAGSYNDTTMLYGIDYEYELIVLQDGADVFAQAASTKLSPNGFYQGQLITQSGDYIIRDKILEVQRRSSNNAELMTIRTDAYGAIDERDVFYEEESEFELRSTNNKTVTDNSFELTRSRPGYAGFFMAYDTTFSEVNAVGLFGSFLSSVRHNALQFEWVVDPAITAEVFTNIYRDDHLLSILHGIDSYADKTATAGEHNYKFVSYYFDDVQRTVLVQEQEATAVFPDPVNNNSLAVQDAALDQVAEITWTYPTDAPLSYFTLSRTNTVTGVSHVVAVMEQDAGGSYQVTDSLGYPGKVYQYALSVMTLSGQESLLQTTPDYQYPAIATADIASVLADVGGEDGVPFVQATVSAASYGLASWDGFMVYEDENASEPIPFSKSSFDEVAGGNVTYRMVLADFLPVASGRPGLALYKHTDEGLYISEVVYDRYSGNAFNATTVAYPQQPTDLTTSADGLQTPLLTASKEVKDKIFVTWEYPDYADAEFYFSYRVYGTATWNVAVLPNEQRAYLHENLPANTIEYKLHAERQGEKSSEVWDYGMARRLFRVEGYAYGAARTPQPYAYVGIADQWVKTDSTGYYVLEDLELSEGNNDLRYIIPGKNELFEQTMSVSNAQQNYRVDLSLGNENEPWLIRPETETFTVQVSADKSRLSNHVRWQGTGDEYHGYKLYKNNYNNEVADIVRGAEMSYEDQLSSNNEASVIYRAIPYLKNYKGEKTLVTDAAKISEIVEFPSLREPIYADAFTNLALGYIKLTWAHERNNVAGYIITRDDEEIGRVSAEESSGFIDLTGLPEQTYRYNIYAYTEINGREVISQRSALVEATYPFAARPTNVKATVAQLSDGSDDNQVVVSWDYPTEVDVVGAVLFRDLDSVAVVEYPYNTIIDSLGIPETKTTYTVRVYDFKDGNYYESTGISDEVEYPAVQKPRNFTIDPVNVDSVWLDWDYEASGVSEFEILVLHRSNPEDTIAHHFVTHDQRSYHYLLQEGVSGAPYDYFVRAIMERNDHYYYSDFATEEDDHPQLPAPVLSSDYVSGEQHAVFYWTDYLTERHDGFLLTIRDEGGVVYKGKNAEGVEITYNQISLPKNQEVFSFLPEFEDVNQEFTLELTAYMSGAGNVPRTASYKVDIQVGDKDYFPENVVASQDQWESVYLNWEAPKASASPERYVIYRDGVKVTTVSNTALSFEDRNTDLGVKHIYQVATYYDIAGARGEFPRSTTGGRLGDGVISLIVLSPNGIELKGLAFKVVATVGAELFEAQAISNESGTVNFRQLAYNQEGITYTLSPVSDVDYYQDTFKEVTLDLSLPQASAGAFINERVRTIAGVVRNINCDRGCGRDGIDIQLYSIDDQDTERLVDQFKTDEKGKFCVSVPYNLDGLHAYEIRVGIEKLGDDGQSLDGLKSDYLEGQFMTYDETAELLKITYPVAELMKKEAHEVEVLDQIGLPLNVQVMGPGDPAVCNVMDGYEFLLRIKDADGHLDAKVWTENGEISEMLPPYDMKVSVIDVNKPDAFSQSVMDYLRSRRKPVNNLAAYLDYLSKTDADEQAAIWDAVVEMRYNERAQLEIQNKVQIKACTGKYVMTADVTEADGFRHKVDLKVIPSQTINGVSCEVTSGYIVPKFVGGLFEIDGQEIESTEIRYNAEENDWDEITVVATTPNLVYPNTQLLEFYYYDDSHNFQGLVTEEIIVLGQQEAPGNDVFIVPQENNLEMVPLFVLRDPPGDNSYAYIEEGSKYEFQLERKFNSTGNIGGAGDKKFGSSVFLKVEAEASDGGGNSGKFVDSYSLEFKQKIATSKKSRISENLEGYLDGPDADVIVGVSMNMSYGIFEELKMEGCAPPYKTKVLQVDPNQIQTTWAYTRSQIKNTIRYYNTLVEDPDGDGTYKSTAGTVFDPASGSGATAEEITTDIAYGKKMFEYLLFRADRQFTPVCQMCEIASDFNTSHNKFPEDVKGFLQNQKSKVKAFCEANVWTNLDLGNSGLADIDAGLVDELEDEEQCKTMAELFGEWSQDKRDSASAIYKKYLVMREVGAFYRAADEDGESLFANEQLVTRIQKALEDRINEIEIFNVVENITFGAGANIGRSTKTKSKEVIGDGASFAINSKFSLTAGVKLDTEFGFWTGVGGGVQNTGSITQFKSSDLFKVKGDYSLATNTESSETISDGLKIGYVLDDDDDGDHFSVDVFNSWTDGHTVNSPFFHVRGGRSSCPYEAGTIPRDIPRIQFANEAGELQPTVYHDVDPTVPLAIPIALSSGNLFGEDRLVQVTVPLGTNKNNIGMIIENVKISNYRGTVSLVAPEENYYTTLYLEKADLPVYDFEDLELIIKPNCGQGKGAYWEDEAIFDTLKFEVHYRKPISPITLSTDLGNWFMINDRNDTDDVNEEATIFKLEDYDVEQSLHSLDKIYLEYKRENDKTWTVMTDGYDGQPDEEWAADTEVLSHRYLDEFYKQKRNSYPEPLYPFTWDISELSQSDLPDGTYQVRANVVHENGSTAFSNILTGTIDRTAPRVVGVPAPADSVLSQADEISVVFDEAIECDQFRLDEDGVSVVILGTATASGVTLSHDWNNQAASQYRVTCDGGSVNIVIDREVLQLYDGRTIEVTISGITDYLGNAYYDEGVGVNPNEVSWSFVVDYLKQTPSPVTLLGPEDWLLNRHSSTDQLIYTLHDYDVFEITQSLTSIDFEYKRKGDTEWSLFKSFSQAELEDNYVALGDNSLPVVDSVFFDTKDFEDGNYSVRAVLTGATGRKEYSGTFSGQIDRTPPAIAGIPEPSDSVYQTGDMVAITFTEAIDCDRGFTYTAEMTRYGDLLPDELLPDTVMCLGDQVVFNYAEEDLRPYFGATVHLTVSNFTDMAGTRLQKPLSILSLSVSLGKPHRQSA